MENILYSIPNNAIYFSSVRLVVGGILNTLNFLQIIKMIYLSN